MGNIIGKLVREAAAEAAFQAGVGGVKRAKPTVPVSPPKSVDQVLADDAQYEAPRPTTMAESLSALDAVPGVDAPRGTEILGPAAGERYVPGGEAAAEFRQRLVDTELPAGTAQPAAGSIDPSDVLANTTGAGGRGLTDTSPPPGDVLPAATAQGPEAIARIKIMQENARARLAGGAAASVEQALEVGSRPKVAKPEPYDTAPAIARGEAALGIVHPPNHLPTGPGPAAPAPVSQHSVVRPVVGTPMATPLAPSPVAIHPATTNEPVPARNIDGTQRFTAEGLPIFEERVSMFGPNGTTTNPAQAQLEQWRRRPILAENPVTGEASSAYILNPPKGSPEGAQPLYVSRGDDGEYEILDILGERSLVNRQSPAFVADLIRRGWTPDDASSFRGDPDIDSALDGVDASDSQAMPTADLLSRQLDEAWKNRDNGSERTSRQDLVALKQQLDSLQHSKNPEDQSSYTNIFAGAREGAKMAKWLDEMTSGPSGPSGPSVPLSEVSQGIDNLLGSKEARPEFVRDADGNLVRNPLREAPVVPPRAAPPEAPLGQMPAEWTKPTIVSAPRADEAGGTINVRSPQKVRGSGIDRTDTGLPLSEEQLGAFDDARANVSAQDRLRQIIAQRDRAVASGDSERFDASADSPLAESTPQTVDPDAKTPTPLSALDEMFRTARSPQEQMAFQVAPGSWAAGAQRPDDFTFDTINQGGPSVSPQDRVREMQAKLSEDTLNSGTTRVDANINRQFKGGSPQYDVRSPQRVRGSGVYRTDTDRVLLQLGAIEDGRDGVNVDLPPGPQVGRAANSDVPSKKDRLANRTDLERDIDAADKAELTLAEYLERKANDALRPPKAPPLSRGEQPAAALSEQKARDEQALGVKEQEAIRTKATAKGRDIEAINAVLKEKGIPIPLAFRGKEQRMPGERGLDEEVKSWAEDEAAAEAEHTAAIAAGEKGHIRRKTVADKDAAMERLRARRMHKTPAEAFDSVMNKLANASSGKAAGSDEGPATKALDLFFGEKKDANGAFSLARISEATGVSKDALVYLGLRYHNSADSPFTDLQMRAMSDSVARAADAATPTQKAASQLVAGQHDSASAPPPKRKPYAPPGPTTIENIRGFIKNGLRRKAVNISPATKQEPEFKSALEELDAISGGNGVVPEITGMGREAGGEHVWQLGDDAATRGKSLDELKALRLDAVAGTRLTGSDLINRVTELQKLRGKIEARIAEQDSVNSDFKAENPDLTGLRDRLDELAGSAKNTQEILGRQIQVEKSGRIVRVIYPGNGRPGKTVSQPGPQSPVLLEGIAVTKKRLADIHKEIGDIKKLLASPQPSGKGDDVLNEDRAALEEINRQLHELRGEPGTKRPDEAKLEPAKSPTVEAEVSPVKGEGVVEGHYFDGDKHSSFSRDIRRYTPLPEGAEPVAAFNVSEKFAQDIAFLLRGKAGASGSEIDATTGLASKPVIVMNDDVKDAKRGVRVERSEEDQPTLGYAPTIEKEQTFERGQFNISYELARANAPKGVSRTAPVSVTSKKMDLVEPGTVAPGKVLMEIYTGPDGELTARFFRAKPKADEVSTIESRPPSKSRDGEIQTAFEKESQKVEAARQTHRTEVLEKLAAKRAGRESRYADAAKAKKEAADERPTRGGVAPRKGVRDWSKKLPEEPASEPAVKLEDPFTGSEDAAPVSKTGVPAPKPDAPEGSPALGSKADAKSQRGLRKGAKRFLAAANSKRGKSVGALGAFSIAGLGLSGLGAKGPTDKSSERRESLYGASRMHDAKDTTNRDPKAMLKRIKGVKPSRYLTYQKMFPKG